MRRMGLFVHIAHLQIPKSPLRGNSSNANIDKTKRATNVSLFCLWLYLRHVLFIFGKGRTTFDFKRKIRNVHG